MVGPEGARLLASKLFILVFLLAMAVAGSRAQAQIGSDRYASMVVDAQTGEVISVVNPDDYRFPASLTKMMTIYLVFEAVRDGRLSFNDEVPMSAWAASMPPTKLGVPAGGSLNVEQALLALVTRSANDVAVALGERLGGSEDRFAQLMTIRAHALGMSRTTFRNASGLPDWGQVTTARDMVVLARHLIDDFPQYYHIFSTPYFQFHGRMVMTHQALLRTYAGADGLKTGYTDASGYNVVTSAMRGNVRLIGVVLGASTGGQRDVQMAALLDEGFQRMGVEPVQVARREPFYHMKLISAARAAPIRPAFGDRMTGRRWANGRRVVARALVVAPRTPRATAFAQPPVRVHSPGKLRELHRAGRERLHAAAHASRHRTKVVARTHSNSRIARAHHPARVATRSKGERLAAGRQEEPRG